jgi:hypothetical protein
MSVTMSNYPPGAENLKSAPYNQPDLDNWPTSQDFDDAAEDLCDCDEMLALTGEHGLTDTDVLKNYYEYRAKLFELACEIRNKRRD